MKETHIVISIPNAILALQEDSYDDFLEELKDHLCREIKQKYLHLCDAVNTDGGTLDEDSLKIEDIEIDENGKGTIYYEIYVHIHMGCRDLNREHHEQSSIPFIFDEAKGIIRIEWFEKGQRDTVEEY